MTDIDAALKNVTERLGRVDDRLAKIETSLTVIIAFALQNLNVSQEVRKQLQEEYDHPRPKS